MDEFVHGPALMWYACKCGHRERVWNSRNAVVPFCMVCLSCGQSDLEHVDWKADELAPDHVPHKGQGVFINLTMNQAMRYARKKMRCFDGTEYALHGPEREEMILSMAKNSFSSFGAGTSPDFCRATDKGVYGNVKDSDDKLAAVTTEGGIFVANIGVAPAAVHILKKISQRENELYAMEDVMLPELSREAAQDKAPFSGPKRQASPWSKRHLKRELKNHKKGRP